MGFHLQLDDEDVIWIQCKYEHVFCIFFHCSRIGHKADDCTWFRREIITAMNSQFNRIIMLFNLGIGVDTSVIHFVSDACAFGTHYSRRTTDIYMLFHDFGYTYL